MKETLLAMRRNAEAAVAAEIDRLREFVAGGCRDWWPTDLPYCIDLSGEHADYAMGLCNAFDHDAVESLECRLWYGSEHVLGESTLTRIALFIQIDDALPARDVTHLLTDDQRRRLEVLAQSEIDDREHEHAVERVESMEDLG